MTDTGRPDTPALDAWWERHVNGGSDHPTVRVWRPDEVPYTILQTTIVGEGANRREVPSPAGDPTAHVHLGTLVEFGGPLARLEAYFAAVVDSIRVARWHADTLAAEAARRDELPAAADPGVVRDVLDVVKRSDV
jgi:hypothetical protein